MHHACRRNIMTFIEVKNKLIETIENNGLIIDFEEEDIDLSDYSIDSLQFISIIVDIEDLFSIAIPDDYLTIDIFKSLNGLTNLIIELSTHEKHEKNTY